MNSEHFDKEHFSLIFDHNEDMMQEFRTMIPEQLRTYYELCVTFLEGNQREILTKSAHKIKGISKNFGFPLLAEKSYRLEMASKSNLVVPSEYILDVMDEIKIVISLLNQE